MSDADSAWNRICDEFIEKLQLPSKCDIEGNHLNGKVAAAFRQ